MPDATITHLLTEPWSEPLLRRAFIEVIFLGIAGGALGCWVILYQLSFGAESLSHALLPGLVIAALTGIPLLVGAGIGIALAAVAIALAARIPAIERDTAVAVVVTSLFGLGALLALSPDTPAGLQALLFGDVLGVSDGDLALAAGLAAGILVALRLLHGRLLTVGFDRSAAGSMGISGSLVDLAVLFLLALVILVAVQGLGNLLVVAILVAPAAAARSVVTRMPAMLGLSAAVAVLAGLGGLYLSYYADTAAGASIALSLIGAYLLIALVAATVSRARNLRKSPAA